MQGEIVAARSPPRSPEETRKLHAEEGETCSSRSPTKEDHGLKRARSKKRRGRPRDPEKLEKGVVHEMVQPVKVFVWICPREKCVKGTFAERFQATVEGFLMVQVNSHIGMHEREDATEKRMSEIAGKAQAFR